MTRLIVIIIVLVIALVGLHFYLQWDMKRFEASLSKPFKPANDEAITDNTAEAENYIDNTEKVNPETSGEHWDGNEWHAKSHQLESASEETQEQPIPNGNTQPIFPSVEELEPSEAPMLAELHAERLELKRLQTEVDIMSEDFSAAIKAQRLTRSQARETFKEINLKLQHLQEQQYQWWQKYVEFQGTEYPGTEHWGRHEEMDEATLREHAKQKAVDLKYQGHILATDP